MPTQIHFNRPPGSDDEQARRFAPLRQRRNEIQRRVIAPVQVFDHQHEWSVGRQRLDRSDNLAQHPLTRRPENLTLQRFASGGVKERRHLRKPHRSALIKELNQSVAAMFTTESFERFQQRQVSFARAVLFQTLPVPDPQVAPGGAASQELSDQTRFTDARLARYKDGLSFAAQRRFQTVL